MIMQLDLANKWQLTLQDEATSIMTGIKDLHDEVVFYVIFILFIVIYYLGVVSLQKNKLVIRSKDLNHNSLLEFIWTILPSVILIAIAIPSFKLLYMMDEPLSPMMTIKILGSQWYWNYEIYNIYGKSIEFTSYLKEDGIIKYLEVDNPLYVPILTPIRLIISATDVVHSWSVPSLGVKLDAIPGRLNYLNILLLREGVYYGQCSELCGLGHGFMPIELIGLPIEDFASWIKTIEE